MPTEKREIRVTYTAIDGCRKVRTYRRLEFAQRFAQTYVGAYPELGSDYAVSGDGVGKITVQGATLAELFPELAPPERVGASFDFGEDWDDFSTETLARREAEKRQAAEEQAQKLADCRARPWVVQMLVRQYCAITSGDLGSTPSVVARFETEAEAAADEAARTQANTDADGAPMDDEIRFQVRLETWKEGEWHQMWADYSKGPLELAKEARWSEEFAAWRQKQGIDQPRADDDCLF